MTRAGDTRVPDLEDDETDVIDLSRNRPRTVPLPFPSPASLDFATMLVWPKRFRAADEDAVLETLANGPTLQRRLAAVHLAGRHHSPKAAVALLDSVGRDPDLLACSMALVAVAAQRSAEAQVVLRLAHRLVRRAIAPDVRDEFAGQAASRAALAAAIAAGWSGEVDHVQEAMGIIGFLQSVESERLRADDMAATLRDAFGAATTDEPR